MLFMGFCVDEEVIEVNDDTVNIRKDEFD